MKRLIKNSCFTGPFKVSQVKNHIIEKPKSKRSLNKFKFSIIDTLLDHWVLGRYFRMTSFFFERASILLLLIKNIHVYVYKRLNIVVV